MQVGDVIVGGAIILQRIRVTVGIIREIQDITAVGFPQQLAAGIEIIVGSAAADGFLGAQAVGVILEGKRSAYAACGGKIAAILPGEVPARAVVVTQRIAHLSPIAAAAKAVAAIVKEIAGVFAISKWATCENLGTHAYFVFIQYKKGFLQESMHPLK